MGDVYLRVDAVNLSNSVYDTEDLSTIRGAGLMILNLEEPVREAINAALGASTEIHLISSGASQAIFRLVLNSTADTTSLVSSIEHAIRKNDHLKYATIVASLSFTDFETSRESLIAKNRFLQMKRLRVSPSGIARTTGNDLETRLKDSSKHPWCAIDMVRPARRNPKNIRNSEKKRLGESAFVRREFGFKQKQKFLATLPEVEWKPDIGQGTSFQAAWDFHQIGEFDPLAFEIANNIGLSTGLNGKIALIYIDGNRFGSKQSRYCTSEDKQRKFDNKIQGRWRAAIKAILDQAWSEGSIRNQLWWNANNYPGEANSLRHRLETLLWGGDEVMWVVPAWFGLSTLMTFFDAIGKEAKPEGTIPEVLDSLTYSAGIVFCHVEAPIQGIIELAHDLASQCKDHLNGSEKNLFTYAVLESFDQLGDEVCRARKNHLPFPLESPAIQDKEKSADRFSHLLITPDRLKSLHSAICWMKKSFPRGSAYQILRCLRQLPDFQDDDAHEPREVLQPFHRLFQRALQDVEEKDKTSIEGESAIKVFDLTQHITDHVECRVNWLHLVELWDYVIPLDDLYRKTANRSESASTSDSMIGGSR